VGASGVTPYLPRLLPEIAGRTRGPIHRVIDGTLVFADLSGFTALSERLATLGGKAGAEEMTAVLNEVFAELLDLAAVQGGEMLKYGGDAVLLLFRGDAHAARAVTAARDMQRGLRRVGNIATNLGRVRLKMSVGVHSGAIDFYVVGPHRELVVAGPVSTMTAAMEGAADAGEILMSLDTAALLPQSCVGDAKGEGVLLARAPQRVAAPGIVEREDADLSRFIPRALRTTLAAGPVQPEHKPATIGFAFVGLDDGFALADLDATFERIETVLATYDVTFLATDLAGGGVKIITAAGLPIAQPDAEERMLRAARDVVSAELPLPVRFGIQRGHVFAGTVGPAYRMAYTVIGDTVNTAARLVARAAPGEVLTLAPVLEATGTEFAVDELAPFVAKGKAEPLTPLRVGPAVGRRRRSDEVLPLVGRDAQVKLIDSALDELRHGGGGVLDIVGDAGMGKSRIVDELVAHAEELHVVRAEAHELDAGRAYGVAEVLLRPLLRVDSAGKLRTRVRSNAPELIDWLPLLGIATGFEVKPTKATQRLAPQAVPAKIREVTVALVRACINAPVVVVVEDLHWADAPSARLLQALGAASGGISMLVATTRRPVAGAIVPPGAEVAIGELADDAAAAMLDRLAGRPLLPDQRKTMIARAGGNPMFLRELAVSLAAGHDGELPDRVESLIEARIDRLDAHDREVLRAASVVGDDFDADEIAAALGEPVAAIVFDRLAGFITHDGRMRFRHALMRDSAYAGLPFRTRRAIHHRVGVHLEARPDAEDNVERLAVHFSAAGEDERAWRYGVAAGDRARARFAYLEAARFYGRALDAAARDLRELDERFRVVDSLTYCAQTAGDIDGALAAARRHRSAFRAMPEREARLALQEGTCLLTLGGPDAAGRAYARGVRLCRASAPTSPTHVRLLVQQSRVAFDRGDYVKSHSLAQEAAAIAEPAGDKPGLAHALAAQYDAAANLSLTGRDTLGRRARDIFTSLNQSADAAVVLNIIGNDRWRSGDLVGASKAYDEAEDLQRTAGLQLHSAVTAYNRALVLVTQGRIEDADPIVTQVLSTFAAAGYASGVQTAASLAAEIKSARGDFAAAAAEFRALAAESYATGQAADGLEIELLLAESLVQSGDVTGAKKCIPAVTKFASPQLRVRCLRVHAVIEALGRARQHQARALLTTAIDESAQLMLYFDEAVARLLRAELFADHADELPAAQTTLERMGVVRVPLAEALR
jgi:class 3 adenylate cyclase/tetratricopeptide (TPR) repeat protein